MNSVRDFFKDDSHFALSDSGSRTRTFCNCAVGSFRYVQTIVHVDFSNFANRLSKSLLLAFTSCKGHRSLNQSKER